MINVEEDQIHDTIDTVADIIYEQGTRYPAMSYEEGVRDALNWVLTGEDNPAED